MCLNLSCSEIEFFCTLTLLVLKHLGFVSIFGMVNSNCLTSLSYFFSRNSLLHIIAYILYIKQ